MSDDLANRDADALHAAAELARWSAFSMAALVLAGAATLGYRRLVEELRHPLDWPTLLAVGVMTAGAVAATRSILRWSASSRVLSTAERAVGWLLSLGLVGWGAAVSLGGTPWSGLVLFWGLVLGEEVWANWSVVGLLRRSVDESPNDRLSDESFPPEESFADRPTCAGPMSGGTRSENTLQEFVRTRDPDGGDLLTGWMRVALTPGQRNIAVHLAFCPPFARVPSIRAIQRGGPPARIKEAQVLPFGARLDVKLSEAAAADVSLLLEITASDATNSSFGVKRGTSGVAS